MSRRALAALLVGAALNISGSPLAHAGSATDEPLTWRSCGSRFECTTLDVPVDHSAPEGERLGIAVTRRRATSPGDRIGSLVVNFGGPGDPGTEHLRVAYPTLPSEVRERFDVVSFDPRGTGSSRPVDCVDDATFERGASEDVTPDSEQELEAFYDGSAFSVDLIGACILRNGDWLARVGTRNVARDLDRLRVALGERQLTYLGFSYGTVIGAVYAQEFPRRVRALVLDSAINLSTTPQQRLRGNARGFEDALDAFLAACAASSGCPYHSGGDPRAALLGLRAEFEAGLRLSSHDRRVVGVSEFYSGLLAALYTQEAWPTLAEALRAADRDDDGDLLRQLADLLLGRRADGSYDNLQEAIGVINCADRPSERVSYGAFRVTFAELTREYPVFGPAFGGSPLGCDPRLPLPTAAERLGDVRARRAPPALLVGVTRDPATPFDGTVDMHRRLRGSRILKLVSTQHTAYARGLACIDAVVDRYLLELELPRGGTRCEAGD